MRVLHQVLKRIYQDSAVLFPPAKYQEVQEVNFSLQRLFGYTLPREYMDFLFLSDGAFWNGLELFATKEHERNKGAFFHRSIIQMNKLYSQNAVLKNKLILALGQEEIVLYDPVRKEYQIMDRCSYTSFLKFPSFGDVLYYYVKNILEK